MPDPRLADALAESLEALMAGTAPSPEVGPRLAELLRVADPLRDLPSPAFKLRLGAELDALARAAAGAASPVAPTLAAHDLRAALAGLPELTMRFLASLDRLTLGVSRFSGATLWERHPDGDELLHVLDGEAVITTLTQDGPLEAVARAGSIFVCPQGLWHRVVPRTPVSLYFATPGAGTEHAQSEPRPVGRLARDAQPPAAHEIAAALRSVAPLEISAATTEAEADAAFRPLGACNQQTLGVMRFAGRTPWERHPDGDELLHALAGEGEITVLTDAGPVEQTLRAGSIFVCPRGLWHRQLAPASVTMLFATPTRMSEVSFAEDPRISA